MSLISIYPDDRRLTRRTLSQLFGGQDTFAFTFQTQRSDVGHAQAGDRFWLAVLQFPAQNFKENQKKKPFTPQIRKKD